MNVNFNLVKKPKKEDEVFDEDDDLELDEISLDDVSSGDTSLDDDNDDVPSSSGSHRDNDLKKRMLFLMGIIAGGTVLLLIILYIASLFSNRTYSYDEVESIMKNAAASYFADYPDYLPKNDGDIVEVDASNLVVAGKMKDLSSYRRDGTHCTGSVQVQNVGGQYLYIPFLNCGDNYNSVELSSKVISDNPVTTVGDGLYSNSNHYIFRGENVNNYVQLDNSLWRIVKINSEGNIVLIHAYGLDYYQPWDNRYNEERLYESGINTYNVSRIKDYLQKIYVSPVADDGEDILSDKDKGRISAFTLCTASRSSDNESKNSSEECRQKLQNQKLGLLTLSEYMYASLDMNCRSANTKSCMNYNYLAMGDEWWLVTANNEDTSTVYKVDRSGVIESVLASNYAKVRPVVYLNSHVMYLEGKGTEADPYKVK